MYQHVFDAQRLARVCFIGSFLVQLFPFFSQAQSLTFKYRNAAFQAGLEYVRAMRFSSDNRYAYTASSGGVGVFHYDAATGVQKMIEVHNMEDYGYESSATRGIMLSKDEKFAYVTGDYSKAIYIFARNVTSGRLKFLGEVSGTIDSFGSSCSIAISPDNNFIYIGNGSVLNIYKRNVADGSLSLVKREYSQVANADIYISKDGRFMYLTGGDTHVYTRNIATGQISFLKEYYDFPEITATGRIAASLDENYLFISCAPAGIGRFERNATTGLLTFVDLIRYAKPDNKYNPYGPSSVTGIMLNPANNTLYVTSFLQISSFSVAATNELILLDKKDVKAALNEPYYGMGLSADGKYIYGFGSYVADTSIECYEIDADGKPVSIRTHRFNESLNKGLYEVTAEALTQDNRYFYAASNVDHCVTAFNSGITQGGMLTEIGRINYADLAIQGDARVVSLIASSDNKSVYAGVALYMTAIGSLINMSVDDNGNIQYVNKIDYVGRVLDMKLAPDGNYLYVVTDNNTLNIYRRDATGALTQSGKLTPTEMGANWSPEQIVFAANGSRAYVVSMKGPNSNVMINMFDVNAGTGALTFSNTTSSVYAFNKNDFKLLISEKRNMAYLVSVVGSLSLYAYTMDPVTGKVGGQIQQLSEYDGAKTAMLNPSEDVLMINSNYDTRFYRFYDDGTLIKTGEEKKIAVVLGWTSGGSESGYERYAYAADGKTIYATRQNGNGVYIYEQQNAVTPMPPKRVMATGEIAQIVVTWDAAKESGVTYEIYRDNSVTNAEGKYATLVGKTTSPQFVDTNVSYNSSYYYWVKVLTKDEVGALSARSNGAVAINPAPASPSNVSATYGDKFVTVTWWANKETDVSHYLVYRNTSYNFAGASLLTTSTAPTYTDTNVSYNVTYYYWIKAVDIDKNESSTSSSVSGTPYDTTPATPTGATITAGDKFIKLSWSPNKETDIHHYVIYRGTSSTFANASLLATSTVTTLTDEAVSYNVTYYYWIKAVDNAKHESYATSDVSGQPVNGAPSAPVGVTINTGDKYIRVAWTPNKETDIQHYEVYKGTTAVPEVSELWKITTSATLEDIDVLYHQRYYYSVIAIDQQGNKSARSVVVDGVPVDEAPAPPLGVTVTAGINRGATVSWQPNKEADLMGYTIYRSIDNVLSHAVMLVEKKLNEECFYNDMTVLNGSFFYWITAVDNARNVSAFSDVAALVITGLENNAANDMTVYPNPARDMIYLNAAAPASRFIIIDFTGRTVKEGAIDNSNSIAINNIPVGPYTCLLSSSSGIRVFKIIKIN